jgi:hypothetical protein
MARQTRDSERLQREVYHSKTFAKRRLDLLGYELSARVGIMGHFVAF